MRAIMLTKTEKQIVILLVVVAIVNFIANIVLSLIGARALGGLYDTGNLEFLISLWFIFGIIIEILVVAVLILMIRKE